ncbi:UDP-N-acetylmuramate:L-alanyl-gamma-D-glutamyl-meso-diaminopimelate ligase [Simiduia curdlanivorans]|uniref:UDP-N-acetylmuramate--L-alanyl-gamma-D-glutamyl-meso-2,6-diaminoheptandioate ligase n=1 Tax=Simiduia curdlanivorans TaxID=1492769 RepID=A0ABV8V3R0_9GAMM|nr:UDP-N-acetylmuramate:L-alanyl-gamma-D-glutamyl-meso-diaminopimelate ligase [Simiduia curdlanivorans]MDN3640840.1 UDP-N-acetylmuramate:L-alanyl-gamma-D-glutamyl-meso-diaminopimelate ligase [Simiduia curdlanivorans]
MHIHILGICGTFMGSLAQLAKAKGLRVTGCDANVYPPMSDQLQQAGIELIQGFDPAQLSPAPDLVVVGNAMSRGNSLVEALLETQIPFTSGPQFLRDHLLDERWVLAVAGTHGKTTTSAMLAWILDYAGMAPGFLIGGVPKNFGVSARLGDTPFFVVEADEYDSAFFDKRSKFVHYRARTCVLNNLEFDHADIFPDLAAIERQFHHLVRTVPGNGRIISPALDQNLQRVLAMGCWSEQQSTGSEQVLEAHWQSTLLNEDGSHFSVSCAGVSAGAVNWCHTGAHNVSNALSAIAAAHHVGVRPETAVAALNEFSGVKRRMDLLAEVAGVKVYDDFAHHPTAIETTLAGLRAQVGEQPIIAVIEPRSNTMRMGVHKAVLAAAAQAADQVVWFQPAGADWALSDVAAASTKPASVASDVDALVQQLVANRRAGSHIVIMSNGGFGGIHQKLVAQLNAAEPVS